MIIAGGNNGPINTIHVKMGTVDTHLKLVIEPFTQGDNLDQFRVSSDVVIRFQDTRELDTFIYALQKFRYKTLKFIGDWVEE